MALFKRDFNKPGPGVPKNAPKKKGVARFLEILGRDFGNLVKLNLLFQLCILPAQLLLVSAYLSFSIGAMGMFLIFAAAALVTSILLGPAQTAMSYVVTKMLRDDPGFVWHDFKKAFKDNFKSTIIPGLFYAIIIGSQGFAYIYYTSLPGGVGFAMLAVYLFSILIFSMAIPYFFAQAGYLELKTGGLVKNSFLLALGYAPRSFMGGLLNTGLLVAQALSFPLAFIVTLFIGYTIPTLLSLMWIWPNIDKTFKIDSTLRKRNQQDFEEQQENEEEKIEDQEQQESQQEALPQEE